MKKPHHELRELLRSKTYSAGATPQQLAALTGRRECHVRRTLAIMPDAYIADWKYPTKGAGRPAQVWRVVVPPPHCPPPPKGGAK